MSFETLGLSEPILRAIREEGYSVATPIQAEAIPIVLEQNDLMGSAQTGTGKTAAFALPTLHLLSALQSDRPEKQTKKNGQNARPIRCLVLVPTRELAVQVGASFAKYGKYAGHRSTLIYGGVSQVPQVRALQKGVEIVVATPGRLLDLMNQGHVDLKSVQVLILDEADQMLDMGFLPDLTRIVAATPHKRQTLMFSATMPTKIRELASKWLRKPVEVKVASCDSTPKNMSQAVYFVETNHKPLTLTWFLQSTDRKKTLVFSRTKHGADKVAKALERDGIRAVSIHGNKSQSKRQAIIRQFNSKQPPVLVATDLAARGLDFSDVSHVINYDLPDTPETYVHRIGRTARAGASGQAISFCGRGERHRIRIIEKLTGQPVTIENIPQNISKIKFEGKLPELEQEPRESRVPRDGRPSRRVRKAERTGGTPPQSGTSSEENRPKRRPRRKSRAEQAGASGAKNKSNAAAGDTKPAWRKKKTRRPARPTVQAAKSV